MTSTARIAQRIRFYRRKAGLDQAELAAPLFTGAYVSMIETGHKSPTIRASLHFAHKLGVPVEELLDPARICKCGAPRLQGQTHCEACRLEARAARLRERNLLKLRTGAAS